MTDLRENPSVETLLSKLRVTGERLSAGLRRDLLACGAAALPGLIAVLGDDALAEADSPAEGWPPIHAADLLLELRDPAAIGPLIAAMRAGDLDDILSNHVMVGLPKFGAATLEPLLAELAQSEEDRERSTSLCEMLSQLGVRDERVWQALVAHFPLAPVLGAGFLASYGDTRGIELIRQGLFEFRPQVDEDGEFALQDLEEMIDAFEELGGEWTEELADHVDALVEALEPAAAAPAVSTKVGRNDPCPCGSGKKYKRCCAP